MLYFYVVAQNAANRAQKGAGMAEYALLLVLIAVACVLAFTQLGLAISDTADSITTDLGGTPAG